MFQIARRTFLSVFIGFFIYFTVQVSTFPLMGLKRIDFWPWNTWHMFQCGVDYNQTLKATGYNSDGKEVAIDLDSKFDYIGGGYRPALLFYFDPIFTELEQEIPFKNRFAQYVAEKHNRTAASSTDKIDSLDLHLLTWYKNRENKREYLQPYLAHRWHL